MVKCRGIELSIISQFDIRKLPEFRFKETSAQPDPFRNITSPPPSPAVASCYVVIYAGSQIWLEYSIDGPHPLESKGFLFKLFFDGKPITSWDCTEKHDYNGRMMYNLVCENINPETGEAQMVRQALKFSGTDPEADPAEHQDVLEVRVHRIEHRQRVRQIDVGFGQPILPPKIDNSIQLTDGGLLEPGFPQRRYKYQLLDPVDDPYATFKFHYRTLEFLKRHGIVEPVGDPASSTTASGEYEDASSLADTDGGQGNTEDEKSSPSTATPIVSSPPTQTSEGIKQSVSAGSQSFVPPSDSEESLSLVTKDSIEDLPSTVPRSPRTPTTSLTIKTSASNQRSPETFDEIFDAKPAEANKPEPTPPSPSKMSEPPQSPSKLSSISPRRLFKKKLTVNINGTEFNIERKKRPLSPFTSGGMLRKLAPPSAPPSLTEFGPTVKDEVEKLEQRMRRADIEAPEVPKVIRYTTRTERGGRQLMGFLNRRLGKERKSE